MTAARHAGSTHRRTRASTGLRDDIAVMAHIGWIDARRGHAPRHEIDGAIADPLLAAYRRGYERVGVQR